MSISTAVGTDRLSRVSGYQINRGNFSNITPNLPQVVVILGEANTANQSALNTAKVEVISADMAGKLYGYGSPIDQVMRILRPQSGDGIGGIPTLVIAQASPVGASASVLVFTVTGTATANATHKLIVNGRDNLDGKSYNFTVALGDTPTVIAGKMKDAINNVPGCPFSAANTAGVLTLTTKWKGTTSASANVVINNNGVAAGVSYATTSNTPGAGDPDISGALALFEDNWYTTVINTYGAATLDVLEAFNGVPDDTTPTGRYAGLIFKPFMAFFGSTLDAVADLTAITDAAARVDQVTNVLCPAPKSAGLPWEAAANMVSLFCRVMQDSPHLDVSGKSYPDMPVPADLTIGDMSDYNNRELLVKAGCSTVVMKNGAYEVEDLVTTYHPADEVPPIFRYPRDLNLDWNVKDGYSILERVNVKDKTIIADNQVSAVSGVIKPSQWKAVLFEYLDTLAGNALVSDPAFSKASLQVAVSPTNPNRFETAFDYKRTGLARIESTTVRVGF